MFVSDSESFGFGDVSSCERYGVEGQARIFTNSVLILLPIVFVRASLDVATLATGTTTFSQLPVSSSKLEDVRSLEDLANLRTAASSLRTFSLWFTLSSSMAGNSKSGVCHCFRSACPNLANLGRKRVFPNARWSCFMKGFSDKSGNAFSKLCSLMLVWQRRVISRCF